MDDSGDDPDRPRFLPILLYVLGFLGVLALLAYFAATLLRHL
jgi:hypothetical protein